MRTTTELTTLYVFPSGTVNFPKEDFSHALYTEIVIMWILFNRFYYSSKVNQVIAINSLCGYVETNVKCVQKLSRATDMIPLCYLLLWRFKDVLPACRVAASGRFCRQQRGHVRLYWAFLFLINALQPQTLPAAFCVIPLAYAIPSQPSKQRCRSSVNGRSSELATCATFSNKSRNVQFKAGAQGAQRYRATYIWTVHMYCFHSNLYCKSKFDCVVVFRSSYCHCYAAVVKKSMNWIFIQYACQLSFVCIWRLSNALL
jgi:hypothetical protein